MPYFDLLDLLPSLNSTGHAASWAAGYPSLLTDCPDYTANVNNLNLNPSLDETYTVLQGILADLEAATGTSYLHLGGDEVVYNCWAEDSSITDFMTAQGIESYDDLFEYFIQKAQGLLKSMEVTPIHWEEVFLAGVEVASNTIFQVWQSQELVTTIAKAKYQVIAAPADPWYLDTWADDRPVPNRWQDMYSYDPAVNLTSDDIEYLLGSHFFYLIFMRVVAIEVHDIFNIHIVYLFCACISRGLG